MTSNLIPIPVDHDTWIDMLFRVHVHGKFYMTEQQYRVYWPLVDGFWTHRRTEKHLHGRFITHYYHCRLSNPRVSSKAEQFPAENLSGKTRVTSFNTPSTCPMKIKVIEPLEPAPTPTGKIAKMWTIEQQLKSDENCKVHNHSIDASWKRKRSTFLVNIIKEELAKGYTPGQVKDRLKGTGRVAGYERLESIGGAFMKRYYFLINKSKYNY